MERERVAKDEAGSREQLANAPRAAVNSAWTLSRFCMRTCSMRWDPAWAPQPTPFIFPKFPDAAHHLSPAFWPFCGFRFYPGQSLAGWELKCKQGADDAWSPLRTAIICTAFSPILFLYVTRFRPASLPRGNLCCQFLAILIERKQIFFKCLFNTLLKRLGAAKKRKDGQRTTFLCCSEQFSCGGQLCAPFFKTNAAQ